jgi:hypothetical protein
MATDSSSSTHLTDAELLYQYLGKRLANGGRQEPLDLLLADFSEYRRQLEQLRALIREAEEASARGESGLLDLDELIASADHQLDQEGVAE